MNNDEMIQENFFPINHNFAKDKERIQNNIGYQFEPNNSLRKTDPALEKQVKFTNYARNILIQVNNGVYGLVRGNAKVNFNESNQKLLEISVENKIYEILNSNKLYIDNNILLNIYNENLVFLKQEYAKNIQIHALEESSISTIGYNSGTGIVMVNPDFIHNILRKWAVENRMHEQEGNQMICD